MPFASDIDNTPYVQDVGGTLSMTHMVVGKKSLSHRINY